MASQQKHDVADIMIARLQAAIKARGYDCGVPLVIIHTPPNSVVPGTVIFEDRYFNDAPIAGSKGIQLLKSHAQDVQHKLIIRNTEIGEIAASNSVGGASAWVRQGWIDTGITYDPMLDPA